MKKKLYFLILLLLPGITIEMLSGSTPPVNYFNPLVIFFFAVCYGLPLILYREMKVRYKLTWQTIFLIPIIGIFIEGLFMQSFFNTAHMDLGDLSNLGVYYSIQWPWTIYLTIIHGIMSFVVPLYIVDFFFPNMRDEKLLTARSTIISFALITLLTAFQLLNIQFGTEAMYQNYDVNVAGTIVLTLVCITLVIFAHATKNINLRKKAYTYKRREHLTSFTFMILLLLATHFLALIDGNLVILCQGILTLILIVYGIVRIFGKERSHESYLPLFNGVVIFFSIFAILQEYNIIPNLDPPQGMAVVGISFITLTIIMNIIGKRRLKPKD